MTAVSFEMLGVAGVTFMKALITLKVLEGVLEKSKPDDGAIVPPKVKF